MVCTSRWTIWSRVITEIDCGVSSSGVSVLVPEPLRRATNPATGPVAVSTEAGPSTRIGGSSTADVPPASAGATRCGGAACVGSGPAGVDGTGSSCAPASVAINRLISTVP